MQAGLSCVYWPHAPEHACTAFNISHPSGIEYSPWKKRFGPAFPGEALPFGCRVSFWIGPKTQRKDEERFTRTCEPGILGYLPAWHEKEEALKEVLAFPLRMLPGRITMSTLSPFELTASLFPKETSRLKRRENCYGSRCRCS